MDWSNFEIRNGWTLGDFKYKGNSVTGFSEQGKEKVKTNKYLSIPNFIYVDEKKEIKQNIMKISDYAFEGYGLKSVSIAKNIEEIGEGAFEDNDIEYAIFYGNLKPLNKLAFKKNPRMTLFLANPKADADDLKKVKELFTNIRNLDLSQLKMIRYLPYNLFFGMDLNVVILPPNLTAIGANAFGFNKLKSVKLPKSLKIIGSCAFTSNELKFVILPDSVEDIGTEAFSVNEITRIDFSKNLKSISYMAFANNKIEKLSIPDSVEIIKSKAFLNNPIQKLRLGNNIEKIGVDSFPSTKEVEKELFRVAMENG